MMIYSPVVLTPRKKKKKKKFSGFSGCGGDGILCVCVCVPTTPNYHTTTTPPKFTANRNIKP